MLKYKGELTEAVVEQARQGRVRSVDSSKSTLTPAVARRVVPELLGAGCSLLGLDFRFVDVNSTWAVKFGKAPVCSKVLRKLCLSECRLRGPLPELRLPALQVLSLAGNYLTGGLEPLKPLKALQELWLDSNDLTGGLEPLRDCTALRTLFLCHNKITGDLEPLRGCTSLEMLHLDHNQLIPTDEDLAHFKKQFSSTEDNVAHSERFTFLSEERPL